MASVHNLLQGLYQADFEQLDIADAATYNLTKNLTFIPVITAGAETRTLAAPTKAGRFVIFSMATDGGDCVITVTGGYDEAGGTTLTFANVGEAIGLVSVRTLTSSGTNTYRWRVLFNDGVAGPTAIDNVFGDITVNSLTGGDSSFGVTGQAAAQGGAIALTGGTSSTTGNAGGAITLTGGTPGATGIGGAITALTGPGQTSSASTATAGGAGSYSTGAGGTTATGTGGNGGANVHTTGAGGAASGNGTGGNGGASSLRSGAGGAAAGTGAATGGVGGAVDATAGDGGTAAGTSPAGAGGAVSVISGTGGAKTGTGTANGGAGGALAITGGAGGATAATSPGTGGAGATVTITAGAGGAASAGTANGGAAGNIVLQTAVGGTSAGGTAGVDGGIFLRTTTGRIFKQQTAPGAGTDQNETLTAAMMFNGIFVHTIGQARTLTTPTGANITAGCPAAAATGDSFDFHLITVGTGADDIVTLTAGDGNVTFVGDVTCGPQLAGTHTGSATWRFRKTGASTWVGYRLA